jgi:hypothetical protein
LLEIANFPCAVLGIARFFEQTNLFIVLYPVQPAKNTAMCSIGNKNLLSQTNDTARFVRKKNQFIIPVLYLLWPAFPNKQISFIVLYPVQPAKNTAICSTGNKNLLSRQMLFVVLYPVQPALLALANFSCTVLGKARFFRTSQFFIPRAVHGTAR